MPSSPSPRWARLRVPFGYAAGTLVLVLARPSARSLLLGLPLALAGEAVRIWASGHIEKARSLATGGPYAYTRNPLYVGSLLLAIGLAVASASPWATLAAGAYFTAFYPAAILEEAAYLRDTFAAEYPEFERDVPLFLPRLRPAGPRASQFSWGRVLRNREWRAALALPLGAGLLCARRLFLP